MTDVQNYNCIICTNTLRCPVKLKIFNSTDEHKCWNKNRLCLRCARKYLQMNDKNSIKTGICKKCPFCMAEETTKNIKFLHAKITYKKDKVLYQKINALIENGTLEKMDCECGEVFDDEYEMENHFKNHCKKSNISCHQCHMKLLREDLEEHIKKDCVLCSCGKFMPRKWYNYHKTNECN